jgi:mono/diheme cytochrome c family protein
VLASILFLAFWVVIALALFFVALRGGVGGARASTLGQGHGARVAMNMSFVIVVLVFGVGLPVALLVGNHTNASAKVGGIKLTANEKQGRALFGQHCGVCHTLAASNSVGKVGPNLDQIQAAYSIIVHTIEHGCFQNGTPSSGTSCLGFGTMPANIVQGREVSQVAQFVSAVAGKE